MARAHHRGAYPKQAAAVRAAAQADPLTRCWRCQRLAHEHPPGRWTAGHINDGQIDGPLAPEWSTCNYAAGARLGNRQRVHRTTRSW